jgi:hypothetical protein
MLYRAMPSVCPAAAVAAAGRAVAAAGCAATAAGCASAAAGRTPNKAYAQPAGGSSILMGFPASGQT